MALPDVTETTYDTEVLGSELPVLVDFWAPWCGPCHKIAPVLEEIAAAHSEKLRIVKCNIDESQGLSSRLGITGIPTLLLYVNGEVVKSITGAKPKPMLLKELADVIG